MAGQLLVITAFPFAFPGGSDSDFNEGTGASSSAPDLARLSRIVADHEIMVPTSPKSMGDGKELHIELLDAMLAGSTHKLQLQVWSGGLTFNGERWRLQTRPVGGIPATNTNDGGKPSFYLVRTISLALSAGRAPPGASADVEIVVDSGDARPEQVFLFVPPQFSFPGGSCLRNKPGPFSRILSCRRLNDEGVAKLQLIDRGFVVTAKAILVVQVHAVATDASSNIWLVQAKAAGQEVGWGDAAGFPIVQMQHTQVIYAGQPRKSTWQLFSRPPRTSSVVGSWSL